MPTRWLDEEAAHLPWRVRFNLAAAQAGALTDVLALVRVERGLASLPLPHVACCCHSCPTPQPAPLSRSQLMLGLIWSRVSTDRPIAHVFLCIDMACCAGDLLWRRTCWGKPGGGDYGHGRELLLVMLCLNEALLQPAAQEEALQKAGSAAGAAGLGPAGTIGAVGHLSTLLLGSGAVMRVLIWRKSLRIWCGWGAVLEGRCLLTCAVCWWP